MEQLCPDSKKNKNLWNITDHNAYLIPSYSEILWPSFQECFPGIEPFICFQQLVRTA